MGGARGQERAMWMCENSILKPVVLFNGKKKKRTGEELHIRLECPVAD